MNKTRLAFLSVFAVLAAHGASVGDEVKALRSEIASNSVSRSTRCAYYKAWFVDQCSKAEHEAILNRNIAAYRRWIELDPKSVEAHSGLGRTLAAVGRWAEAKPELEKAVSGPASLPRAFALWELANCLWVEGDRDGAAKAVSAFVDAAKRWPSALDDLARKAKCLQMSFEDPDADMDHFKLPHSEDGKPFPTPQEAKYGEGRVSLAKVEVLFGTNGTGGTDGTSPASRISPASPEDPIVRLLKKKLTRFGAKFDKGGTKILIEISPNAPVGKPQGYSLDVANGVVSIKARDRLGATWGVVSFLQCVERRDGKEGRDGKDEGRPSVRECTIRDWPVCLKRGTGMPWQPTLIEYALFSKMSSVGVRLGENYVFSPLEKEMYHRVGRRFNDFGISIYGIMRYVCMRPLVPLSSPRTFRLHLGIASFLASAGFRASFALDDERFPMHPLDIESSGTGANLDAKYVTRLYRAVKKDFPEFGMNFCPPFYWGPDSPANYPEPRDPYLRSIASDLDPDIAVIWTGGSVGTWEITPEDIAWEEDRIGRKPFVSSNGDGANLHASIQFGADPPGFKKSHCPDVLDRVAGWSVNSARYQSAPTTHSAMDWCWNPDAHDPATAVRRAVEQLEGPGVSEIIAAATPSLTYLDKYKYGKPHGELFSEDADDLDCRVAVAEAAWSNVLSIARNGGLFVENFKNFGIKWARNLAAWRRNPPEWLVKQQEAANASVSYAKSEVGFDEANGDVFIPAEMLVGGGYGKGVKGWSKKRPPCNVKYLGVGKELTGSFECDPFPSPVPYKMIIVAMRLREGDPVELEVEVNGRVVWRGESLFKGGYFSAKEVAIPVDALQRGNKFSIRNVASEEHPNRKALVHYVVIRKK